MNYDTIINALRHLLYFISLRFLTFELGIITCLLYLLHRIHVKVIRVNVYEELRTRSGTQKNLIGANNRQSSVEAKKGIGTHVGLGKGPQEW